MDGGAASNDLLMQCQADLLGVPVHRPACLETTALGAAYLAGLAVEYWPGLEEIKHLEREGTVFTPNPDRARPAALIARWNRAVARAKEWNAP